MATSCDKEGTIVVAPARSRRDFLARTGTLGVALLAGGLTSCSGFTGGSGASDESAGVDFFARGDQAIWKVFRQLREEFTKRNPDTKVNIEQVPGDFYQKFQLKLASGTPPDSLFECSCTITSSIRAGAVEPLDELIKSDPRFKKDEFLPTAWDTSEFEGKTYGLPYDGGSMAIYCNLDLFEKAGLEPPDPQEPMTWDQVVEYGRQLTLDRNGKRPGQAGFDPKRIKQYGFDPAASGTPWPWVWASEGEVITKDRKVPLDEPEALEGLQFVADLGTKHSIAPTPAYQQSGQLSFLTGNVAMAYDGVWATVRNRQAKFDWDVVPFPTGRKKVSTGWYSPLSITSKASDADKQAAWNWISFCTSEDGQKIVSSLGQSVPSLRSLAEGTVFLDESTKPRSKQVFLDEMNPDFLRTPGDTMGKHFGGYVVEWGNVFTPVWESVLTGKRTAAVAMKEVRPKLERLLATGKTS